MLKNPHTKRSSLRKRFEIDYGAFLPAENNNTS